MTDATAGPLQFRPGGPMDRAAHAAAHAEMLVGGVDDDIDIKRGDIPDMHGHTIGGSLRHRNLLR